MYESHWGFTSKPFENTSDPEFYYPSHSHQAAMLKLRYAIDSRRAAAVLTGAPGLGKSLLVGTLLRNLPETCTPRPHIVFPQMPVDQLLSVIADELDAPHAASASREVNVSVRRIQQQLLSGAEQGQHAVLVIDEAHLVTEAQTLEAIRLLANFEHEGVAAMTVILSGQPSLIPALDRHRDLEERLAVKSLLRPFEVEETSSYIHHRLRKAGGREDVFADDALETIHRLAHGNPRQINRICDLALLVGYAEQKTTITSEAVQAVAEELVTVSPD